MKCAQALIFVTGSIDVELFNKIINSEILLFNVLIRICLKFSDIIIMINTWN